MLRHHVIMASLESLAHLNFRLLEYEVRDALFFFFLLLELRDELS